MMAGCVSSQGTAPDIVYQAAPSVLPNTFRQMKTPGFWVSRHPYPDKVILTADDIKQLNKKLTGELKFTQDILSLPESMLGEELKAEMEKALADTKEKNYFTIEGTHAGAEFFGDMRTLMGIDAVPREVKVRYGVTVGFSDQRFFPTIKGLYAKEGDIDFDELQNSDLDIATPLAVLHESQDGQWYYVKGDHSDGWVKAENIALCPRAEVEHFLSRDSWAVVVSAKADVFGNIERTEYLEYARMGARFPMEQLFDTDVAEVRLPTRTPDGTLAWGTGYLSQKDIHEGFLPYTPRNVIEQAFKLLNAPYGWGGMHGEQDCSRYMHEIFSTFGIVLPRNSKEQAQAAQVIGKFAEGTSDDEKFKVLREQAVGGITLLGMKGHIMLYLGMAEERAYAIHATWGYRVPAGGEDRVCVVNRVIVSDLSLGEGTKKGSLLRRLNAIVVIGP